MLSEGQGGHGRFVHAQVSPEMTYTAKSQRRGISLSRGALQDSTALHLSKTERK